VLRQGKQVEQDELIKRKHSGPALTCGLLRDGAAKSPSACA
jgi:hypothetical protein